MNTKYNIFITDHEEDWITYLNITEASRNLNGVAFKLYIYFMLQEPNTTIQFSPSVFVNEFGGGTTSVRRAMQELIQANYLKPEDNNTFSFFKLPNQNG